MLLKRFYHDGLAQASYLVGCQQTGEALVVDPNRDAGQYIAAATENGFRVTHVTETHIHADYLSGSRELARRAGARLFLSAEGGADWQYAFAEAEEATLLRGGDVIQVGKQRIDVVHTPGHTPEHLTFVLTDTPASSHPVGAFTGDFIFAGDVGRPDLLERAAHIEGTMRSGAAQLFRSLRRFASEYPDYIQIWPGHGAGSACGKSLGAVAQTTLGYERVANWAFQIDYEGAFVDAVLDGQPDPPTYFATMKRLNREGPDLLGHHPAPSHVAAAELARQLARGAQVVDVRRADAFAEGFVPGTLNIPLTKAFVTWAGWLLDYTRDIYLLTAASDESVARRAATELAMIGLDRVVGWFGAEALAAAPRLDTVPQVTPNELAAWLRDGSATVIDVRAIDEWEAGHIKGAMHLPLGHLTERFGSVQPHGRLVVQCQGGSRSAIAASLLRTGLAPAVWNLHGGLDAWLASGLPLTRNNSGASL